MNLAKILDILISDAGIILAAAPQPIVLIVIFWVLWLLWAIGAFAPDNPTYTKGGRVVAAVLIGILGFCVFGFS